MRSNESLGRATMSELAALDVAQTHFPISTTIPDSVQQVFKYLGPPTSQFQQSAYDNHPYSDWDMREAYKGKNLFMTDTITGYILEANDFYTTLLLPWMYSEQLHVRFNEWHFNSTLAGRVPYEGISRLVTSSKKQFVDHQVRRGLAFVLEADFYTTDEGKMQWYRNVQGIAQAVQETQNHDTIDALLRANNTRATWNQKFGNLSGVSYRTIIEDEIVQFAAVASEQKRLDILYQQGKQTLMKRGVTPDIMVMSPGSKIYLTMAMPTKTLYSSMGPDGATIQREGPDAMRSFMGEALVFETRSFDVYVDSQPIQLLTRSIQIGERYEMTMREYKGQDMGEFQTSWRDTYIYDENIDFFTKISFQEAMENCKLLSPDNSSEPFAESYTKWIESKSGQDAASRDPSQYPLFTHKVDGRLQLCEMLGDMPVEHVSDMMFRRMAESVGTRLMDMLAGMTGRPTSTQSAITEAMDLADRIDKEPYSEEYFSGLIEANQGRSLDHQGKFVGSPTPHDLAAWNSSLRDWVPNSHGSLNLPAHRPQGVTFPAGFANYPGLCTLAEEASNEKSEWHNAGVQAKRVVDNIRAITGFLRQIAPSSLILSPSFRSPWHQRESPESTFFDSVVSIQRDPIWLASPLSNGSVGMASSPSASSSGTIELSESDVLAAAKGKDVTMGSRSVRMKMKARALAVLGEKTMENAHAIFSAQDGDIAAQTVLHLVCQDKTASGLDKARSLISSLHALKPPERAQKLSEINLLTSSKTSERGVATQTIKDLVANGVADGSPAAIVSLGLDKVYERTPAITAVSRSARQFDIAGSASGVSSAAAAAAPPLAPCNSSAPLSRCRPLCSRPTGGVEIRSFAPRIRIHCTSNPTKDPRTTFLDRFGRALTTRQHRRSSSIQREGSKSPTSMHFPSLGSPRLAHRFRRSESDRRLRRSSHLDRHLPPSRGRPRDLRRSSSMTIPTPTERQTWPPGWTRENRHLEDFPCSARSCLRMERRKR